MRGLLVLFASLCIIKRMKHTQYTHVEENEFATLIAPDVELEGTIKTQDTVLVKGKVMNGTLHGGMVCVSLEGHVQGTVKIAHLIVSGMVEGKMRISENLHILKNGEVKGSIETVDIVVDKGAKLNSTCKMLEPEALLSAEE